MRNARDEEVLERRHRRIGEFVDALGKGVGLGRHDEGVLVSVKARFPTESEPSLLLIVRCQVESVPYVAFVGAYGLGDAVLAWRGRSGGRGMKWRDDLPWEQRVKEPGGH